MFMYLYAPGIDEQCVSSPNCNHPAPLNARDAYACSISIPGYATLYLNASA